ncbi:MAG: PEP-CTERM system histidine kinase PrsK [Planctomycetes bacterium]|nr:PEP-CTERM system histidine kinase PrsK [Planctomycetota bacterium]
MNSLGIFQLISGLIGLGVGAVVYISPRFGTGNSWLGIYLLTTAIAALTLAVENSTWTLTPDYQLPTTFFLLALSVPMVFLFSLLGTRAEIQSRFSRWRVPAFFVALLGVGLAFLGTLNLGLLKGTALQNILGPPPQYLENGRLSAGRMGYWTAFYMLIVSAFALANLEQTLRSAQETVRWSIKFLLIGLAVQSAFFFYMASRIILTSALPERTLEAFPFILLPSNVFILLSWNRIQEKVRVAVSQGLVYSSITLIGAGIYLVVVSLASLRLGELVTSRVEVEVPIILASVILLGVVLLSTRMRHKVRRWIRLNIFSGKYDYRTFWMEAAEHIHASDAPEKIAQELAELVHRALGAIQVTVWLPVKDAPKIALKALHGSLALKRGAERDGLLECLHGIEGPVSLEQLAPHEGGEAGPSRQALIELLKAVQATLCVPLRSGGQTIGLLTVGSNRSGHPFETEDREFLRVLVGHAAGELHMNELLTAQIEAKEAEAFRRFSTFLLHDLKNYSSTLSLLAKNAARHQENPEFQKDAFQSIEDTAQKMRRLCNTLGTFSTSLARNRRPEDLNQIAKLSVQGFSSELAERLRLELDELPQVSLDAAEVGRVLHNLLLNAFEASPDGQAVRLKTSVVDGFVEVAVIDQGRGMSKEFLEKELFLPFHTTKSEGLGIGLFQSRKIVEAHGGTIHVESEEGKGTTVRVRFPAPRQA